MVGVGKARGHLYWDGTGLAAVDWGVLEQTGVEWHRTRVSLPGVGWNGMTARSGV